ncbi:MAG: N-acetylmuramoyl-L-alanine amidase [Oscillospiraceae bacterium]|nr:N-acetylmuramoyl-L-alanine amidase [Oscillospiraceae bacterium]
MNHRRRITTLALATALAAGMAVLCLFPSQTVPVSDFEGLAGETVVIDAGHGGEDGGAVSISGAVESAINLEIALKLDNIFGLYGVHTVLLRDSDISLHDADAVTLHEKKVSDLQNRVAIIEALQNPILISIHQNTYPDSRYSGAQVFYANGELSLPLAELMQQTLRAALDPDNDRTAAAIPDSVYLMNHISCRAILVECGFLSNPEEDALLQSPVYQTKLAAAMAGGYFSYLERISAQTDDTDSELEE